MNPTDRTFRVHLETDGLWWINMDDGPAVTGVPNLAGVGQAIDSLLKLDRDIFANPERADTKLKRGDGNRTAWGDLPEMGADGAPAEVDRLRLLASRLRDALALIRNGYNVPLDNLLHDPEIEDLRRTTNEMTE